MENQGFEKDPAVYISSNMSNSPQTVDSSVVKRHNRFSHETRVGLADAMQDLSDQIGADTFCAPLNQGELTSVDKYKLGFLIFFPCFFFILAIVLTATLK